MTAPTLRQLLADVLRDAYEGVLDGAMALHVADALLASPELAEIIDIAAREIRGRVQGNESPEVRALLENWRTNRES